MAIGSGRRMEYKMLERVNRKWEMNQVEKGKWARQKWGEREKESKEGRKDQQMGKNYF